MRFGSAMPSYSELFQHVLKPQDHSVPYWEGDILGLGRAKCDNSLKCVTSKYGTSSVSY